MRQISFYGSSDDLFCIRGTKDGEPDEIGTYDRPASVKISNNDGGLLVTALYSPTGNGCWMIGITPIDEDVEIPSFWDMHWEIAENGYSAKLTITCPIDVKITAV